MRIIDSQVHLAAPGQGSWVELPEAGLDLEQRRNESHLSRRHPDLDQLIAVLDRAGVAGAVLVPASREFGSNASAGGEDPFTNDACITAAQAYPDRFRVMMRIEETEGEQRVLVNQIAAMTEVLGLRFSFHGRHNQGKGNLGLLAGDEIDWLWTACEDLDVPVMIFAPGQTNALRRLATRHPSLRIMLDHLGVDVYELQDDLMEVVRPVLELAQLENVAVKASTLAANVKEEYPFPRLKECVRTVIAAYGAERVFWGSDMSRLPCRYETWLRFFTDQLDFLSDDERSNVLGEGLARWLRWDSR